MTTERTMDVLNEFMKAHREPLTEADGFTEGRGRTRIVDAIECHDGFHISVQGHYGAYCAPRQNDAEPYYQVECGFPSGRVPELRQYKDGEKVSDDTDMESVYGYVPVDTVIELLAAHGGIKGPKDWTAEKVRTVETLRAELAAAKETIANQGDSLDQVIKERDEARSAATASEQRFASAVETLVDIAAMGKKAGSESAKHRLTELGIEWETSELKRDYGSMT
jgi:hypothetical protein